MFKKPFIVILLSVILLVFSLTVTILKILGILSGHFAIFIAVLAFSFLIFLSLVLVFYRKQGVSPNSRYRDKRRADDQRYKIDIYLSFNELQRNAVVSDISSGGCFIYGDLFLEPGETLAVQIVCGAFRINLSARIMRRTIESEKFYGYGLMFIDVDKVQKEGIKRLLDNIKAAVGEDNLIEGENERRGGKRFLFSYQLSIERGDMSVPARLIDISKKGCSVSTFEYIPFNNNVLLKFSVEDGEFYMEAQQIWNKALENEYFYGLKFTQNDGKMKESIRSVISAVSKTGSAKEDDPSDGKRWKETPLSD